MNRPCKHRNTSHKLSASLATVKKHPSRLEAFLEALAAPILVPTKAIVEEHISLIYNTSSKVYIRAIFQYLLSKLV